MRALWVGPGEDLRLKVRGLRLVREINGRAVGIDPLDSPSFDWVIVGGGHGLASFEALRWLAVSGVPVSLIDYSGAVLGTLLPADSRNAVYRIAQVRAHDDPAARLEIAKMIVRAKTGCMRDGIGNLTDLLTYEGRLAAIHFDRYANRMRRFGFEGRNARPSTDPVNAALNYCYALLESRARIAIHRLGLDPAIGFLHAHRIGKDSLAFDLMEVGRAAADRMIAGLFENATLRNARDFARNPVYGMRLKESGAKTVVEEFSKVDWDGPITNLGRKASKVLDKFVIESGRIPSVRSEEKRSRPAGSSVSAQLSPA